jgi:hypothetical protein
VLRTAAAYDARWSSCARHRAISDLATRRRRRSARNNRRSASRCALCWRATRSRSRLGQQCRRAGKKFLLSEAHRQFADAIEFLRPKALGFKAEATRELDVLRAAFGRADVEQGARDVVAAWDKVQNYLADNFIDAGGALAKRERYFPNPDISYAKRGRSGRSATPRWCAMWSTGRRCSISTPASRSTTRASINCSRSMSRRSWPAAAKACRTAPLPARACSPTSATLPASSCSRTRKPGRASPRRSASTLRRSKR